MRHLWPVALVLWVGCKPAHPAASVPEKSSADSFDLSNDNKAHPTSGEAPRVNRGGNDQRSRAVAGTFDRPVMTCGPLDSYAYVAREFRCADGRNPLGGQLGGAQRARTGSRPHPGGHIIDLYEVPCAGGAETVFVDMYGCSEAAATLEAPEPTAPNEAAAAFDKGQYKKAVGVCLKELDGGKPTPAALECLAMTPAALMLDGADAGGLRLVGAFCGRAASAEGGTELRKQHVMQVARWLARGGRGRISREQFRAMVDQVATACGVNDGQGA